MAEMYSTSASKREDATIKRALRILENRIREPGQSFNHVELARNYLTLKLAPLEREVFTVLFLDNRHRLIASEDMFHGTLAESAVYPREVVKRALQHNAAALIVAHNHPSGHAVASLPDIQITDRLKAALGLVGIELLDHFIIAGVIVVSLAEQGWKPIISTAIETKPKKSKRAQPTKQASSEDIEALARDGRISADMTEAIVFYEHAVRALTGTAGK